ncbi:Cation Channel Sperm Associated 1 CatSper1 [Carpediemonas membranifera]|uniref:Cation Channel Sperm Associated 1 CatSper1 n=1 Tax=Carpediemonas membranifera TaxID=201153 RepID=A0A8J6AU12_9EUKA|nr:Cation Channel Sperm Associated 1 CatSper1 [Carpediemonas membranifera]|eukprot:KAG9394138.1 Cation Channel Sperm Associated 1 CatSper1 [Carpediemonas membranifera]
MATASWGSTADTNTSFGGTYTGTYGGSMGSLSMASTATSADEDFMEDEKELFDADEIIRWPQYRKFIFNIATSSWFNMTILGVIFLNTVMMTLQTISYIQINFGWYMTILDNVFLAIYVFELLLKFAAFRLRFFKSGWNLFDLFIVLTSFLVWVEYLSSTLAAFDTRIIRMVRVFRAVRALRALRVLRTISFLKQLQDIVSTIFKSIPALMSIMMLIMIVIFIFSVIARELFSTAYPERFGSIQLCLFSLFQLITMDDWSTYREYLMNKGYNVQITIFCVVFIVVGTFILSNLFTAVIVNNLEHTVATKKKHRGFGIRRLRRRRRATSSAGSSVSASSIGDPNDIADTHRDNEGPDDQASQVDRNVRDADYYYGKTAMAMRDRQMLGTYFTLLSSLESHLDSYQNKQKLLDDLVDLAMPESRVTEDGRV